MVVRARAANGGEDGGQGDVSRCAVVGMVEVGGVIGFLVGVGRIDVLRWVVREDDVGSVFANESHDASASGFTIGEVPIGEAQKLDGLHAEHFTCHALFLFACKHQFAIDDAGDLATFSAV